MTISICVGSSCHLKGSYDIIEELKRLVKKYDVEDLIELQSSFCLGNCAKGVTIKVNDEIKLNISRENIEDIFIKEIYPMLNL